MSRTVKEWFGKTDDAMPGPNVRLRIFETHGGVCHISGRKIGPSDQWDIDHIIALADGGENRETNLAPAIRERHREKTSAEATARATGKRKRMKAIGIKKAKRPMQGSRDHPGGLIKHLDGSVSRRR
jgi:5-methylcytosine-specific restriction protein A